MPSAVPLQSKILSKHHAITIIQVKARQKPTLQCRRKRIKADSENDSGATGSAVLPREPAGPLNATKPSARPKRETSLPNIPLQGETQPGRRWLEINLWADFGSSYRPYSMRLHQSEPVDHQPYKEEVTRLLVPRGKVQGHATLVWAVSGAYWQVGRAHWHTCSFGSDADTTKRVKLCVCDIATRWKIGKKNYIYKCSGLHRDINNFQIADESSSSSTSPAVISRISIAHS